MKNCYLPIRILLVTFIVIFSASAVAVAAGLTLPEGLSEEKALQLGERMYRDGILPSGEPMQAVVMNDIPVDGRMFTCDDCHQRSGLGSEEGTVITWPTNGREISKPRRKTGAWREPETEAARQDARKNLPEYWKQIEDVRPAYTDETLATVLWTGIDPAGRKLDPIMPLYHLEDSDMAIMVHYLNNLSAELSPGVDDTTIRFATVVTENVAPEEKQAMLAILQAHIDMHNSQSRHQERRAAAGPFYKTEMHQSYRRWQLDVWELQGPADTWPAQLADYYQRQPVFALLGGMAEGSWQPVHEFCEKNKLPAILPLTDFPVISETDWYTLYFSKGFYQEGEAAARFLHLQEKIAPDARVVMISRADMAASALSNGFSAIWLEYGHSAPVHLMVEPDEKLTEEYWRETMEAKKPDVLVLWLAPADLAHISTIDPESSPGLKIILSSEMLAYSFAAIPDTLRPHTYLTYPYSLPDTQERSLLAVRQWLNARKIPVSNIRMQSKMYFIGWMLAGAVKRMRSEYFREYFMEGFDMMVDQDYAIGVYPRLTFGSGQRFSSKGCYIVQLSAGPDPELIRKSDWVIH